MNELLLAHIFQLHGKIVQSQILVEGMKAENQWRIDRNETIAYGEKAFNSEANKLEKIIKALKKIHYEQGIEWLQLIKADLRKDGRSFKCPNWSLYAFDKCNPRKDCTICKQLFPKISARKGCPCHNYRSSYLIKRLNEIIRYNKKEES